MYLRRRKRQKGLSQLYRNENTDRNLSDTDGFGDEITAEKDESLYYVIKSPLEIPDLFQETPRKKTTFKKNKNGKSIFHCDWTDSIESNQNAALKEMTILQRNNQIPTKEIIVGFLTPLFAKDINERRKKFFEVLRNVKLQRRLQVICPGRFVSVVGLELTRGEDGKPNNTVHFHFLTKDPRNKKELKNLFITAGEYCGLVNDEDYRISCCRKLGNGMGYFRYFTKFGYTDKVILLKKGTGLQRFYTIGPWFALSKSAIWKNRQ